MSVSKAKKKQRFEGHHEFSDGHHKGTDDDRLTLSDHGHDGWRGARRSASRNPPISGVRYTSPRVEAVDIRSERLHRQRTGKELERARHCLVAQYALGARGREQILGHVEDQERAHSKRGSAPTFRSRTGR
jgi:hypothetical protein